MLFRIFLIGMISWAIFKLYRILTGRRGGVSPFQRGTRPRRYEGKAVDADFEDLDDTGNPGKG
jgi:hypothetical protein